MSDAEATETTETTTADQSDDLEQLDLTKLRDAIRKERETTKEFKRVQREAAELRKFKTEAEQAKLTADEKLAARERTVAEQEQRITSRLQASILRDEISNAAAAAKITLHAPIGDVLKLLDMSAVEWDGEQPKNVRALLGELVKERPYLASRRTGSADGGAGTGQSMGKDMNTLIREAAGRG